MSEEMSVNFKKVLFLSKVLLSLFIVSILIFINFLDYKEMNNNRKALGLLNSMVEKERRGELSFESYELGRLDSLKQINPTLHNAHTQARIALVEMLNRYGAFISRSSKGDNAEGKNQIILITNKDVQNRLLDSRSLFMAGTQRRGPIKEDAGIPEDVNAAIDLFNDLSRNEKCLLLSKIDLNKLQSVCDSILLERQKFENTRPGTNPSITLTAPTRRTLPDVNGTGGPIIIDNSDEDRRHVSADSGVNHLNTSAIVQQPRKLFSYFYDFLGLAIHKDGLHIYYGANYNDRTGSGGQGSSPIMGNAFVGQKSAAFYDLLVPANSDSAFLPSTIIMSGLPENTVLQLQQKSKQQELRNLYGKAKMTMIDEISVDLYKKNAEPISILGFSLSRKWFPIALFLVFPVIAGMIYNSVRRTKLTKTASLSSDDSLSFLLTSSWLRFFVWIIMPVVTFFMVFYSSFISYEWPVYLLVIGGCIVAVLFGAASFKNTRQLGQ